MSQEKEWKPLELVKVSASYLASKAVPNPRLDCEILLSHALHLGSRINLYAAFDQTIDSHSLAEFRDMVRRRASREPVSRILGEREFMGLTLAVTPAVFSPRPETELLVEGVLAMTLPVASPLANTPPAETPEAREEVTADLDAILDAYAGEAGEEEEEEEGEGEGEGEPRFDLAPATARRPSRVGPRAAPAGPTPAPPAIAILDLGTGSGCIAVALADRHPTASLTAVDVSPEALSTARLNAAACHVAERISFHQGSWFAACPAGETYDVVVSNPPYLVRGDQEIWPEVSRFDPEIALYGGEDGLECFRAIIAGAAARLTAGGSLFLEIGAGQAPAVTEILVQNGFAPPEIQDDAAGHPRVLAARREN
ncbi:MAG: peptide chain release factor N(5)-glutamine methyltransferase [Planctomycetota bacterium]|nr:peptide chain release factor N(5)-glutamine methyltransferase [Planctomycetota bacterium]